MPSSSNLTKVDSQVDGCCSDHHSQVQIQQQQQHQHHPTSLTSTNVNNRCNSAGVTNNNHQHQHQQQQGQHNSNMTSISSSTTTTTSSISIGNFPVSNSGGGGSGGAHSPHFHHPLSCLSPNTIDDQGIKDGIITKGRLNFGKDEIFSFLLKFPWYVHVKISHHLKY
jgi:hypothetical protein